MKAVFLDRDGTLILDPPDERVDSLEEIEIFPDTLQAMKELAKLNHGVFIITNQAGIGEGRITEDEFWKIENKVKELLEPSDVKILKTYVCPHRPEDNCECRKPKPHMVLQAAKEFGIDLANSYFIGDRLSDIETGHSAGTKTILVQTGNMPVQAENVTYVAPHLLDAVEYIASHQSATI